MEDIGGTSTLVFTLINLANTVITSFVTFLLTRKKYRVEVEGGKIENSGMQIDNKQKDLNFYITLAEDNRVRLDEYRSENQELRSEVAEMRTVIFGMLQQICTDMICQNRKFDKEACPYYEKAFGRDFDDNTENE